jgi:aconitate hydratase
MTVELDMIKGVFTRMEQRVEAAHAVAAKLFPLMEKILHSQLREGSLTQVYGRLKSDVDFAPVCVHKM